jgi:uncharacterized protein YycO
MQISGQLRMNPWTQVFQSVMCTNHVTYCSALVFYHFLTQLGPDVENNNEYLPKALNGYQLKLFKC